MSQLPAPSGPVSGLETSQLLMRARCKLLTTQPWYGTIASLFTWKEGAAQVPTIGVRVISGGVVECIYNSNFCDRLTLEEMIGVIQHEIEHIVRLHCVRLGSRDPRVWNIATDMTINGKESSPHIRNLPKNNEVKGIYYPEKWDLNLTSEEIYDRLGKTKIIIKGGLKDQNGNSIGDVQIGPNDAEETITIDGKNIDDHDVWQGSSAGEDEARQVVKDLVRQASIKAGNAPGHLQDAISELDEPIVNWKYELRQFMGRAIGGKRHTWSRQNRRRQEFGVKGKSNHASVKLTVGVDTSGSVDNARIQQFFGELESMSQKFKITLVQFDHGYQRHDVYHRGDWKKIPIQGRGGTSFTEFFRAIEEKKLVGKVNLVLTDGEADYGQPRDYDVMWVIIPHRRKEDVVPTWGRTIYIEK